MLTRCRCCWHPPASSLECRRACWDPRGLLPHPAAQVSLPGALEEEEAVDLLSKLHGLHPGSRRIMLQQLLEGGIMRVDPQARAEWEAIQEQFKPPADFRMKVCSLCVYVCGCVLGGFVWRHPYPFCCHAQVVDVNRTCKGTRTGGLYRYR